MNEWQSIETAPKNGERILLYIPQYSVKFWFGHYYCTETLEHGKLKYKGEGWSTGAMQLGMVAWVKDPQPTHWMPLPEAPNG